MVVSASLCATAKDFNTHLRLRMVFGIAAGQSEALVPMITQVSIRMHQLVNVPNGFNTDNVLRNYSSSTSVLDIS
jgi:predicted MFS family arabinose efflux permease